MRSIWRWLALFAWRRWSRAEPRRPTGIPGNRDPDDPCPAYSPRPRRWDDFSDCLGDGHYLCRGCCHLDVEGREGVVS